MVAQVAEPYVVVDMHWFDPQGRSCDPPFMHEDPYYLQTLYALLNDDRAVADADPEFTPLTFAFCRTTTHMTYTVKISRSQYDADADRWVTVGEAQ